MISILLKKVKENWQILVTALVTWSIFDLYNYYIPFGIEIQSYVSISEIILLVFPSILNGIIAILIIIIFFTFSMRNERKVRDPDLEYLSNVIDEYHSKLFHVKDKFKRLKKEFKPFKIKNIFSIIIEIVAILMEIAFWSFVFFIGFGVFEIFRYERLSIYPLPESVRFILLALVTFFFLSPLFLLISEFFEKYGHKAFSNLIIYKSPFIYFITAFIFNSILSNRIQYLSIINGQSNKKIIFQYHDKKIETNKSLVYIGATQSYIFLRNNEDSISVIFKKEDINDLSIQRIKNKATIQ